MSTITPSSLRLSLDAARVVTDQIREATARTLEAMADVETAVARAYAGQAWSAMGYDSWDSYCAAEFSQARLWSTVDERKARVVALRGAGLSQRAIAAVIGVNVATASRDLASISGVADATADTALVLGPSDGELIEVPSRDGVTGVDGKTYRPHAMPAALLERKLEAASLHNAGLRQEEIAEHLRVSQATVSADLAEMRRMADQAPAPIREAIADPTLTRDEVLQRMQVMILPSVQLGRLAGSVVRDLAATMRTLHAEIYMHDAWSSDDRQRREAATAIVPELGEVLLLATDLASAISRGDVDLDDARWLRWTQSLGDARRALAATPTEARA